LAWRIGLRLDDRLSPPRTEATQRGVLRLS